MGFLVLQPLNGVTGDVFREVIVVGFLLGNRGVVLRVMVGSY